MNRTDFLPHLESIISLEDYWRITGRLQVGNLERIFQLALDRDGILMIKVVPSPDIL